MTALVRYEAARAALQAAHDVDEVKDIRDKAQAMAAYAKQANDTALVEWATEIKVRAERRAGAMLAESKVNGARHNGKTHLKTGPESHDTTPGPTLENIGISRDQSSRWQKLAAIPESVFEKAVAEAKGKDGEVTTAALLRATKPKTQKAEKPSPKPQKPAAVKDCARCASLDAKLAEASEQKNDLADTARELSDKLTAFETTDPDEQQKEIMKLQKRLARVDGEVQRLTVARNDCNNKNNDLIREVKRLQKKLGAAQ